ncbi:MAG: hypothetical protein CMO41_04550 [Verrucomicrobiales bacterium]|nr:hypothetical protein [Verrucomicrobiales bacterium]
MRMEARGLLFWTVCIPLRVTLASNANDALRALAAVIGVRWLSGMENGNEGVFGGVAWWAKQRPVHGALWSAYAVSGDRKFLYLDTAYGAYNWFATPKRVPGTFAE